jgi:flagellar hook-basal body complex protein FliE
MMSSPISTLGPITSWSDYVSPAKNGTASSEGFSGLLYTALQQVNELSSDANVQVGSLLQGGGADMNTAMVAVEKADVAFQLMMQVRNKVVSAYQDIEKMQF